MRWEYLTVKVDARGWLGGAVNEKELVARLNGLGEHGWELVTGFDTNMIEGASRNLLFTLKRPLDPEVPGAVRA